MNILKLPLHFNLHLEDLFPKKKEQSEEQKREEQERERENQWRLSLLDFDLE